MADAATRAQASDPRRFLTFRMEEDLYAVAADEVAEVIRVPPVARVPQAPRSLLGVANLRGSVLPIASLRGLLGRDEAAVSKTARTIVLQGEAPVGLYVDAVEALISIDLDQIETRQAELAARPGERLIGAFQPDGGSRIARILDLRGLLAEAFTARAKPQTAARPDVGDGGALLGGTGEAEDRRKLVTFEIAGQEFALDLEVVHEIVPAPPEVTAVAHSEEVVLGVMAYRATLLPLLSLRGLLGFGAVSDRGERRKVVVTAVGGVLVGLVVDGMRAIVSADPDQIEATPALLAARTGGETRITAIYRGDEGRRLISILAPDRLFREDVMARLGAHETAAGVEPAREQTHDEIQVVVFRLGDDEFGLPIEVVDEVARVPDQVTRLPKTPPFLEGVINLRGEVLPVIDQRRRFDMDPADLLAARRLIVVRTDQHRAGLIVDSVSEVLRTRTSAIEPAPDLTGEVIRLVHGVINLERAGRLVLLLDPAELLSRSERSLLDAFQNASESSGA